MKKLGIILILTIIGHTTIWAQEEESFARNNLSFMMSDVVMKRISFEYEHVFGDNGNMSINIPASVAIGDQLDVYDDDVDWWVGMGMKFYPTGQGVIRYFVGPEVRIISAQKEINDYHSGYTQELHENLIHSAFLLNNGMIYEPSKGFIFSVNLGLGIMTRDSKDSGIYPMATPSVRLGIRF